MTPSSSSGSRLQPWTLLSIVVALLAVSVALRHSGHTLAHGVPIAGWLRQQRRVAEAIDRALQFLEARPREENGCQCGAVSDPLEEGAACQLQGVVPDCCCSYAAVERVNRDAMQPILGELVRTPYFRYFKTDLYCECPLWPDDAMCSLRDCSVCECEPHEVPAPWRKEEEMAVPAESCDSLQRESDVDRTILPSVKAKLTSVRDWKGYRNPWMPDENGVEYSYINLLRNPERYTGYKGEHAYRVWAAIYQQPCFAGLADGGNGTAAGDQCAERRVFYKLISGMHSSITAHIVGDYLIDEATQTWGPNLEMFRWRLGNEAVKNRVENLYFTYLFVLRAVLKAGPLLKEADYVTGVPEEDAQTRRLMRSLVDHPALKRSCPVPFDEGRLWKGEGAAELRGELQAAFRNTTRIMDCVGCEKCKMWGKLQLLGIATSLKVLFSAEDCGGAAAPAAQALPPLVLERNEVIALVNLLERLANSVEVVRSLSLQLTTGGGGGGGALHPAGHPNGVGAIQDLTHRGLAPGLTV